MEWTPGRLDKLDVYRKLDVPEVWYWRRGTISVFVLRGEHYEPADHSGFLPRIDLRELDSFLEAGHCVQTGALTSRGYCRIRVGPRGPSAA